VAGGSERQRTRDGSLDGCHARVGERGASPHRWVCCASTPAPGIVGCAPAA